MLEKYENKIRFCSGNQPNAQPGYSMFGRRDFVRGVVATTTAAVPLVPQGAMAPFPPTTHTTNPRELTLPLRFDRRGGSYVLDWELNGRAFSGKHLRPIDARAAPSPLTTSPPLSFSLCVCVFPTPS